MSDSNQPTEPDDPPTEPMHAGAEPANPYGEATPAASSAYGGAVPAYGAPPGLGPAGQVRSTGTCVLFTIVTLGFYTWYWFYKTHEEMKQHTGQGLGGVVALLLAIFLGFVMPFFSSHEVGNLYERRGQAPPVTVVTGLWYLLLGWFFLVGAIVWFVRTNKALNDYWESVTGR